MVFMREHYQIIGEKCKAAMQSEGRIYQGQEQFGDTMPISEIKFGNGYCVPVLAADATHAVDTRAPAGLTSAAMFPVWRSDREYAPLLSKRYDVRIEK
jgi:hypothetical protein